MQEIRNSGAANFQKLALSGDEKSPSPNKIFLKINFGSPDLTWDRYGLAETPILFNGAKTPYKAITRENKLVTILGNGYKVLPNEEAVKIADEAAEMAGLVPFHEFSGEWFQRMEKHVIYDKDQARVHALYASNKHYDVNGEKMHIGVGVHNSIDGTTAFGCGIFTFRHACANMVLAGTRKYTQQFDQRKTIEYIYQRHTASLNPVTGDLKNKILTVMDRANEIISTYQRMATEKATQQLIERLRKSRLSAKVLPDYVAKPEEAIPPADLTQWQLYNDITAAIWHNAKAGLRTKQHRFNVLHQIIPIST